MLLNEGAKSLVGIDEFISKIIGEHKQLTLNFDETKNENQSVNLTDDEKIIYGLIQRQSEKTQDEILIESGLDFMNVQEGLMNLEIKGLIINSSGRYSAA